MRRVHCILVVLLLLMVSCQRSREGGAGPHGEGRSPATEGQAQQGGHSSARFRKRLPALPLKELAVLNRCVRCHSATAIN